MIVEKINKWHYEAKCGPWKVQAITRKLAMDTCLELVFTGAFSEPVWSIKRLALTAFGISYIPYA